MPRRLNVKNEEVRLTDGHERARNFLSDAEMDGLREHQKVWGHSDHAQANVLPAQAYLQDVMPGRQQRGCRCQRPHESAALPHFLVLPSEGLRQMCSWERFCAFTREPEHRRVAGDARIRIDGAFYDVDADLAGETVTVWWGLFDHELFVEFRERRPSRLGASPDWQTAP